MIIEKRKSTFLITPVNTDFLDIKLRIPFQIRDLVFHKKDVSDSIYLAPYGVYIILSLCIYAILWEGPKGG